MVGGDSVGAEKLKIGELADRCGVTKRTVDHYTNLGLLKAERSPSNYRYYDLSSLERIHFIETCKAEGMHLADIGKRLLEKDAEEIDLLELRLKISGLDKDVSEILSQIDRNDPDSIEKIKKNISHESFSLIQTLLLLLS
ncbi:MerR family transcriptional regulator [Metabacillus sp. 84]|uniref:MerR family transcriptional regulator n=1 Tax=unclassified Metabacillus TaxID=2675274 RepID=UPI003CF85BC7